MIRLLSKPRLKELREKLATQKEMANLINVQSGKDSMSRGYYNYIENRERSVDPELGLTIARILKVEVSEVFESKDQVEEVEETMEEIDQ